MRRIMLLLCLLPFCLTAQKGKDSDAYFNYLEQLYLENTSGLFNSFLQQELRQHSKMYPNSSNQSQVLYMLANINYQSNRITAAIVDYLRLLYQFPQSNSSLQVKKDFPEILDKCTNLQVQMVRDTLISTAGRTTPTTKENGWFEMISFLYGLQIDTLSSLLLQQINDYRIQFGKESKYNDILLFWSANISRNLNRKAAAFAYYRQLIAMYPGSDLHCKALLNAAIAANTCPGNLENARNYYMEVINNYTGSDEAAEAQYYLAVLYEDSLKLLNEALCNYHLFAENYPGHELVRLVLKNSGKLAMKLKKWPEASEAWQKYYELSPKDSTSIDVLKTLINLNLEKQKNYENGAQILLIYAVQFNDPQKMYLAAQIYANTLKDKNKAKETCSKIIELFPESAFAPKAKKLLDELN